MEYDNFHKILSSFSENKDDLKIDKGHLSMLYRDELIEASLSTEDDDLWITENESKIKARHWLLTRIARMPILADKILNNISSLDTYIPPYASVIDGTVDDFDEENPVNVDDAGIKILDIAQKTIPGASSVIYLTADAGEGKTTILSEISRKQAVLYKNKQSDFLILPILMGGKPFLSFDDVVTGTLVNKLRFQVFFYDAFIELVRLGVIVPAFDGFEEMFVQSQGGDALTAVGNLMSLLKGNGRIIIAARKAYFDYQDTRLKAKLYDSISSFSVTFSRVGIKRWEKTHFIKYLAAFGLLNGEEVYDQILNEVGDKENPVLTRAVLVHKLAEVALDKSQFDLLLGKLTATTHNYFKVFVEALIEREAKRWLDSKSDPAVPLLTEKEHFELLSILSQEMWLASTNSLKVEMMEVVAEIFSDTKRKSPSVRFQISERLKQHAFIISDNSGRFFSFDHEEFKNFFLGYSIFQAIEKSHTTLLSDLTSMFRKGEFPLQAIESASAFLRSTTLVEKSIKTLLQVGMLDGGTSFSHQNSTELLLLLINNLELENIILNDLLIPKDGLSSKSYKNLTFTGCSFSNTDLNKTSLENVVFDNCQFDRLELSSDSKINNVQMLSCRIVSIALPDRDVVTYDPEQIPSIVNNFGFKTETPQANQISLDLSPKQDQDYITLKRLLRYFYIHPQANEHILLQRLGVPGKQFIKSRLDDLLRVGILTLIPWSGGGEVQRRFKLSGSMTAIDDSMERCDRTFDDFIKKFTDKINSES